MWYCVCRVSCRGWECPIWRYSVFYIVTCVDCLWRGVGSLRLQPCSEVTVRLTSLMLFHSLYVAWAFAADSTNKFNKIFIRSHQTYLPDLACCSLCFDLFISFLSLIAFSAVALGSRFSTRKHCLQISGLSMRNETWNRFSIKNNFLTDSTFLPLWRRVTWIQISASLSYRKESRAK